MTLATYLLILALAPLGGMPKQSAGMSDDSNTQSRFIGTTLSPRVSLPKRAELVQPDHPHRLIVKFRDDLKARSDAGRLFSDAGKDIRAVEGASAPFAARFRPLIRLDRERIEFLERRAAERSGVAQPDLGGMFIVEPADDAKLLDLARALTVLPETEFVTFEDLSPEPPCSDIAPTTPDYESFQGYAGPDPGINMLAARALGNAEGAGMLVADCEYGFHTGHEDLCDIIVEADQTPNPDDPDFLEHGTAVLGELVGLDNAYGVTGLVPQAQGLFFTEKSEEDGSRRVDAIAAAIAAVDAGDVVVLEMQTGDPYAPAETNEAVWTITKVGTDADVIMVAAAGNGAANLDSGSYAEYRGWGDSGAIIVGAGSADTAHDKLDFSSYGARVNVQGWGQSVRTLGYGNLEPSGSGVNQYYTASFNGTSSATPIAAAACVALQALAQQQWGYFLSPRHLRELLEVTGVPQGSGGHIGPLPDVVAAAAELEPSLWVDFDYGGTLQFGTFERPLDNLADGLAAAQPNELIRIKSSASPSAATIADPVRIKAWGGLVRIGAP